MGTLKINTMKVLLHCFLFTFINGWDQPVQEGNFYLLYFQTKERYVTINFQVNNGSGYISVSSCNVTTNNCTSISPDYVQYMKYDTHLNSYISKLQIKSVRRNLTDWIAIGTDAFNMEHEKVQCNIPVYALLKYALCDTPQFINKNTYISLTCRALRGYPAPECLFQNYSPTIINPILNYTTHLLDDTGDVDVTCIFVWQKPSIMDPLTLTFAVTFLQFRSVETKMDNISINLFLFGRVSIYISQQTKNDKCSVDELKVTCNVTAKSMLTSMMAKLYMNGQPMANKTASNGIFNDELVVSFQPTSGESIFRCDLISLPGNTIIDEDEKTLNFHDNGSSCEDKSKVAIISIIVPVVIVLAATLVTLLVRYRCKRNVHEIGCDAQLNDEQTLNKTI